MKTNPALRVFAFLLCALTASAGFWAGYMSLVFWDDLWTDSDYYTSSAYYENCSAMESRVQEVARLERQKQEGGLTYSQQEFLEALQNTLAPENTNYRYELRIDSTGELVSSNLGGTLLEDQVGRIEMGGFTLASHEDYGDRDEITYVEAELPDSGGELAEVQVLRAWTGEDYVELRADQEPEGYNAYGWYNSGLYWDGYDSRRDTRVTSVEYALRSGALLDMRVDDMFRSDYWNYMRWHNNLPLVGVTALVCITVCLATFLWLCFSVGHKQGVEGISLGWPDRVPLDVYTAAVTLLAGLGISLGDSITTGLNIQIRPYRIVGLIAVSAVVAAAVLGLLLTTLVRVKAHKVLDSLLVWRLCRWCWRLLCHCCRAVARALRDILGTLTMDVRLGLGYLVYLGLNAFLSAGFYLTSYSRGYFFIGLVLFNGGAFWLGCRWIEQWKRIRAETGRVLGGDTTAQIDTARMYPDLRQHAEQLNDLGASINRAVDERMKSEHFKAELITNVSHDLKTPLTSIINYVDLLKKTDITDPKALEYLEVLDRKSQRLKKLTEDLIEASKVSTGNVTVNAAQMDLVEFTQQALAEYEDRMLQQRLTLVAKMAGHPVYISADGRHMWRILDNLLGNCVKYALEGTRVYLDVVEWDGKASISVKNISRDPLEVDPEALTERFVRGDESRTTEGSGLGLSIARSLTEVQGGTFRVTTDGDLFKVTVYFPVVLSLEENNFGKNG